MNDIRSLEAVEEVLDAEEKKLISFIRSNHLTEHRSAFRAFRFGLKFIYWRPKIEDTEDGLFKLRYPVDSVEFLEIYKRNLPLFLAFDMANVPKKWVLINMTADRLYLLLKTNSKRELTDIVKKLSDAKTIATDRAEWNGILFYKVIDGGGQNEVT